MVMVWTEGGLASQRVVVLFLSCLVSLSFLSVDLSSFFLVCNLFFSHLPYFF